MRDDTQIMIDKVMEYGSHAPDCNKRRWKAHIKFCPCDCYERLLISQGVVKGRADMLQEVEEMMQEVSDD